MADCKQKYEQYATLRETFLNRARECAKVTIPTLVPPSGAGAYTDYPTPYQGVGARGVNNLASKLLLSLLPPNSPFFRLEVDDFTLQELSGEEGARAKVEEGLNKIERAVQSEIEQSGLRSPVFEAIKQLIVAGNVLVWLPKDGGTRVFRMDQYVVQRDPLGDVLTIIIKEQVSKSALEEDVRAMISEAKTDLNSDNARKVDPKETCDLYTKLYRDGDKWKMYQEIEGMIIPGSEGTYPKEKSPMLALRWTRVDGEDYGRSYVEEYLGDLVSLEGLSKAILETAAASSKVVFLVNPNGVTRARDLAKAPNGAFVSGNANEVTVLQTEKRADLQIAQQLISQINDRLAFAFLMNTAIQRNGERVTAQEVRYMAQELEDALGGVYSILSQEFQTPLVNRLMDRMTKQKKLPALPKGVIRPAIVSGLEALGRGHDLSKYQTFLQNLQPLGPEAIAQFMNVGDYITRVGTSLGIDMDGLVRSDEEIIQQQQQAKAEQQAMMEQQQMAEMAKSAMGPGGKLIGDAMAMAQDQQQPQ